MYLKFQKLKSLLMILVTEAPMGMGAGEDPLPYQLQGLGERCELPSGVRGESPVAFASYSW